MGVGLSVGDVAASTVMRTVSVSVSAPSDMEKVTGYVPTCAAVGVQEKVPVSADRNAPWGMLPAEQVRGSSSGSVAERLKVRVEPACTDLGPRCGWVGGRLTLFTVMVTSSLSASWPSDTEKLTWYVPARW